MTNCYKSNVSVADSWLYEAVCRQRPELWLIVAYMKPCVDRDQKCGESWLHEAVCRQRPEQWVTVRFMKLCVDRILNSSCQLVTLICV